MLYIHAWNITQSSVIAGHINFKNTAAIYWKHVASFCAPTTWYWYQIVCMLTLHVLIIQMQLIGLQLYFTFHNYNFNYAQQRILLQYNCICRYMQVYIYIILHSIVTAKELRFKDNQDDHLIKTDEQFQLKFHGPQKFCFLACFTSA